jgi:hypothetical protein
MGEVEDYLKTVDTYHHPDTVPDFSRVPDGTYQMRLDKIYITKSKKQTMQTVFELEIINGDYAFRKVNKYCGMEEEKQLDFLTQDLRRFGLKDFTWATIQDHFPAMLDKIVEVKLVSKVSPKDGQTYQSTYIQKMIDMNAAMTTTRSSDDVPF